MLLNEVLTPPITLYRIEDRYGKGPFASVHEDGNHNPNKRWGWRTIESALGMFGPEFEHMVWPMTRSGYTLSKYVVNKVYPTEEGDDNEAIFYLSDVISKSTTPVKKYLKKKYLHHDRKGEVLPQHKRLM